MDKQTRWEWSSWLQRSAPYQGHSIIGGFAISILLLCGCGSVSIPLTARGALEATLVITPDEVVLMQGAQQQFLTNTTKSTVSWRLADKPWGGTITAAGLFTAPPYVTKATRFTIIASTPDAQDSSASVTVSPCTATIQPSIRTMPTGATQQFLVVGCPTAGRWSVNGIASGNLTTGTISSEGEYQAPRIDPGFPINIGYEQNNSMSVTLNVIFSVTNRPLPQYVGVTYATTLASWNASLLPWVERLSGLDWDTASRRWLENPQWFAGASGIAPNVYYLEEALRPITRMATMHHDLNLLDELAAFHTALLQYRTTSVGNLRSGATSGSTLFIDGLASDRTFAWYEPQGPHEVRIRDCQTCNAQYLSTAARLLRAIAELPPGSRSPAMLTFTRSYAVFLVSEQLLRLLYGTTAWSHWNNPTIPQPAVAAWDFLAKTAYRPIQPLRYQAALTDIELWLIADAAETLSADQAAPDLNILDETTRRQLKTAVTAGVSLLAARSHHQTAPDGADVLSVLAGDYDDHPDYAYSGDTGPDQPTSPAPMTGLSWDISHSYRLPILFRTLFETKAATGLDFPQRNDLVALANAYVHLASDGDQQEPQFHNFLDGWDGWFQADGTNARSGYPPSKDCVASGDPDNCLIPGALQGWGELAFINPDLAALSQRLVDLAYLDSGPVQAFKRKHYFYAGQPYAIQAGLYPQLMIYVAADAAERLR